MCEYTNSQTLKYYQDPPIYSLQAILMDNTKDIDAPATVPGKHADAAATTDPRSSARTSETSQYHHNELFGTRLVVRGNGDGLGDHWSVPWSDLMMVMFVLFAALLSVKMLPSNTELPYWERPVPDIQEIETERVTEKQVPSPKPSFEPLMRINVFDRSQDAIEEMELENVEVALLDDQSVKVSVEGPMFFERSKANLQPEMIKFLDRLANVIRKTPFQVHVIGHTDDNPIKTTIFPSNWELSLVRASRVARHLIRSGPLEPERFTVMGRGQYDPAYPNSDDAKRALNRRVEIIITREVVSEREE